MSTSNVIESSNETNTHSNAMMTTQTAVIDSLHDIKKKLRLYENYKKIVHGSRHKTAQAFPYFRSPHRIKKPSMRRPTKGCISFSTNDFQHIYCSQNKKQGQWGRFCPLLVAKRNSQRRRKIANYTTTR